MRSPFTLLDPRSAGDLLPAVCLIGLVLGWHAEAAAADTRAGTPGAATAVQAAATMSGLWGSREIRSANLIPFKKWLGVLERYETQRDLETEPCQGRVCPVAHWRAFLDTLEGRDLAYQINSVHRYVNAVRYIPDQRNNGVADNWATPAEFLGRGGDCEDYAIAKYLSLKNLGFPRDAMRIVVLKDRSRGIDHAVLIVWDGERWLMLDNQLRVVVPADKVAHYQPHFSINEESWWLHKKGTPSQTPSSHIVRRTAEQIVSTR